MLSKLKRKIETSFLPLPLSIIVASSPLPPLSTLLLLARLKVYPLPEELMDLEELRDRGYAGEFVEFYEEVLQAQRSGQREGIKDFIERKLAEAKSALDLMDYNVSILIEVLVALTLVAPLTIGSVIVFIEPGTFIPLTLVICVLAFLIALLSSVAVVPPELWLPPPRLYALLPFTLYPPFSHLVGSYSQALAICAAASGVLVFLEQRRKLRVLRETEEYVRRASTSRNPFLAGIEDLDALLSDRFFGVSKAIVAALYVLFTQGGRRYGEGITFLRKTLRNYLDTFKGVRKKAAVSFLYALIMSCIASVSMAFLLSALTALAGIPTGGLMGGFRIPSYEEVRVLIAGVDLYVAITALTYSVSVAALRDGNPLYFSLYLFPLVSASYASYVLALKYAPLIFGW